MKYCEFKKEQEAIEWLNYNYGEFLKNIQQDSYKEGTLGWALFNYTGSLSKNYNKMLRDSNGDIENLVGEKDDICNINLIYNAFNLNELKTNIILFHYFDIDFENLKELSINKCYKKDCFISTTMLKKTEGIKKLINNNRYNAVLEIKIKQGTKIIPIGNNPRSKLKEYEIILHPNCEFKIIKKKRKWLSKIKYVITCEIE